MIELPEARWLASQLNNVLVNKVIKDVLVNSSPHKFAFFHHGSFKEYYGILVGRKIIKAEPNGGQVEVYLDGARLVFTDGANIRIYNEIADLPKKHQFLLTFTDNTFLVVTIQMYGGILAFLDGKGDWEYYLAPKKSISPYSTEFTYDYFYHNIAALSDKLSVKAMLATEQRFPGLGNGVLQDILFNAHINPKTKKSQLILKDYQYLYQSIKDVLNDMFYQHGRNTEKDIFGVAGGYTCIMTAQKYDEPCPNCHQMKVKEAYMGGNIYYCPVCQPLK